MTANKLTRKTILITTLLMVILTIILTSCGQAQATPDKVTVQLSWFHSAEFVGFYVAKELGYYAEQNLDVTLVIGGPEVNPVESVVDGSAQFGVASGDGIIRAQAEQKDVIAVSSIFRKSPLVAIALPESGIRVPKDLVGKTVGVISTNLDTTWDIQFIAMLKKLNIDPASIKFVGNEKFHGADDLLSGRMDASSGNFLSNEPLQAKEDGHEIVAIYYSDYGIEFYSNTIFTSSKLRTENSNLVQRFIQATLKGYQYSIEHAKEAAKIVLKYDNSSSESYQQLVIETQIPLLDTGDAPLGFMDESIWANTQSVLLDQGFLSSKVDLAKVYTNEFVESVK